MIINVFHYCLLESKSVFCSSFIYI